LGAQVRVVDREQRRPARDRLSLPHHDARDPPSTSGRSAMACRASMRPVAVISSDTVSRRAAATSTGSAGAVGAPPVAGPSPAPPARPRRMR
jgi:hypothetical protein